MHEAAVIHRSAPLPNTLMPRAEPGIDSPMPERHHRAAAKFPPSRLQQKFRHVLGRGLAANPD